MASAHLVRRVLVGSLVAAIAGGCVSFREEVPVLPPITVGGAPLPGHQDLISGQVPMPAGGGGAFTIDPALVGGIGTAAEITVRSSRQLAHIPAISINWSEIKDLPVDRRADFIRNVDGTLRQLQGAEIIAKLSLPRPGMEVAHAQMVQSFEAAIADLNRQRADLEFLPPERWEAAKDSLHETWLNTQSAFVRAAQTGY